MGEEVPQGPWRGGGWAGHWMSAPLRLPHPVQQPDGRCGARRGTLWERPEQVERRSSPLPPAPMASLQRLPTSRGSRPRRQRGSWGSVPRAFSSPTDSAQLSFPTPRGAATQDVGIEPHVQGLPRGPHPCHPVPGRLQHQALNLQPLPHKSSQCANKQ